MSGLFITVEGGEGAGKSTQIRNMHRWLQDHGHDVLLTRQPGGTPLAEKTRAMLLDARNLGMNPLTELLLLFADRAEFMAVVVRPALASGQTVLCDRFTDSTYAYQGGGRGMPAADLAVLEQMVHGDHQPDLTLLLDLDVRDGMARAAQRSDADRFEQEDLEFFENVRKAYLARAASDPQRFEVIDASAGSEQVWQDIEAALNRRLGQA